MEVTLYEFLFVLMPKVSIVVPVYNVEQYLRQCLDSILAQTFTDWECILVDDGSTDNSGIICEEYAKKDRRFSVAHKENGGVSSARNRGISLAKGEWLFFSDADDTLVPDALKVLIEGTTSGCKFVMAGFNIINETGLLKETAKYVTCKEITIEDAIMEQYRPSDFSYQGYLWCKLFAIDLVRSMNLRFDETISYNEDGLFIMQYVCGLQGKIFYTTVPVYNYLERDNSAMGILKEKFNPKFVSHFDSVMLQKEAVFAYTRNRQLRKAALQRIVNLYMYIHEMMIASEAYDTAIHRKLLTGLFRTGAICEYMKEYVRCILGLMKRITKLSLLLLWPTLISKLKKQN